MLHLKLQYNTHVCDQDGPINPSHTPETIFNVKRLFYSQNLQTTWYELKSMNSLFLRKYKQVLQT